MRASLAQMALMKGRAWMDNEELKDLKDFKFLFSKMRQKQERFETLGVDEREVLEVRMDKMGTINMTRLGNLKLEGGG